MVYTSGLRAVAGWFLGAIEQPSNEEDKMPCYLVLVLCLGCFAAGFFFCGILSIGRTEMPDPPEHVAGVGSQRKGW